MMGAQITISLINTALTAIFLLATRIPHAPLLIVVTFLCGLVPIVGNLVSNTIIVFVALTVSLKMAISALVFLIIIHKLEYLLNSKIIGDRIRNPVWLTLIALILGERLMGIPGLILAPVVPDRAAADLVAVQDEVVLLRADVAGIGVELWPILFVEAAERVVRRVPALVLLVPLEEGEIDDPAIGEHVRIGQPMPLTQLLAKSRESLGDD